MYRIATFLMALLLLTTACQSMQKLYEDGEYEKAHRAALQQLEKDPKDQEARDILHNSFTQLLDEDRQQIAALRQRPQADALERALQTIEKNQKRIAKMEPFVGQEYDPIKAEFGTAQVEIREDLFYRYLEKGEATLNEAIRVDNARQAQQAHGLLQRAQQYARPGSEDASRLSGLIRTAAEEGIIYYQVAIDDGFNIGLSVNVDRYFGDLEGLSNNFRQIEIVMMATDGDCAIDIDFGEFESNISEEVDTENFEAQVVVDYETEEDSLGVETEIPIYGTVYAEVEIVTSRKTGIWEVEVDVDALTNNCDHSNNRYSEEVVSEVRYYRTSGDERALPSEYRDTDRKDEHLEDEEMAEELLELFYRQICRDYFGD